MARERSSLAHAQEVSSSIDVDAPAEVVWEVTMDPAQFPEAIDWVSEARTDDDVPLGEGSVYHERGKPGLRESTYRWEVVSADPPRRAVHYHRSGEFEAELELRLEALEDDTTRYTQILRFRSMPAFRPLGYVLERTLMKRQMQRDFDETILPNFKHLAEARVADV